MFELILPPDFHKPAVTLRGDLYSSPAQLRGIEYEALFGQFIRKKRGPRPLVVQGSQTSRQQSGTTTHTVSLPASVAANELIVVFATYTITGTTGAAKATGWAGYTEVYDIDIGSGGRIACYRKSAIGGETTVQFTTGVNCTSTHNAYRVSGTYGVPQAVTATGTGTTPNPPNLVVAGAITNGLWFVAEGNRDSRSVSAYPTNFTDGINITNAGSGETRTTGCGTARRIHDSVSQDPGTFTISGSTEWGAATVFIPNG